MKHASLCGAVLLTALLALAPGAAAQSNTDSYDVVFPQNIDVSVCAGKHLLYSSQVLDVDAATGSFNTTWSPNEPNTLNCAGMLTPTGFSAILTCGSGSGPMGSVSAIGPGDGTYSGTYTFNGVTGPITISRKADDGSNDGPVLINPSLSPNPAKIGDTVTLKGEIVTEHKHVSDSGRATFTWGDGSPPETYTPDLIPLFKSKGLTHVYQSAGVFNIHIHFFDLDDDPTDPGDDFDIFEVVGDASAAVKANSGLNVIAQVGSGGTVGLSINAQTVSGAANASTVFEDSDGTPRTKRASPQMGFSVQQSLGVSGLYVATTDVLDSNGNTIDKIRKTVGIGKKIAGESDGLDNPASTKVGIKSIKGKFFFNAAKPDDVTFNGQFMLPPGFSLNRTGATVMEFSIGNVVDTVELDAKGKTGKGQRGRIKKLRLTLPRLKDGVAIGGETAKITAQLNVANLTGAGFDTEGITASRGANEAGSKAVQRFIQINMLFSGVSYEVLAPVNFAVSRDAAFGSIQGRK